MKKIFLLAFMVTAVSGIANAEKAITKFCNCLWKMVSSQS